MAKRPARRAVFHRSEENLAGMHSHIHTQIQPEQTVIGIDPGRGKCGIAAVRQGAVLKTLTVRRESMIAEARILAQEFASSHIAIGGATGSASVLAEVKAALPDAEVLVVDETNSTREGIALRIATSPPSARWLVWLKLFFGTEKPDGWAAAVIAKRALAEFSPKL